MQIGTDTVAVVTGGASGIGRSCATEFARRGASVVVADINDSRLAETVSELQGLGVKAMAVRCDVTQDDDLVRLRDESISAMGHVDLLMNNAGVALFGPPEHVPIHDWRWIFEINVFGAIRGVQAFVPYFQERGKGHILNTSSIAGLMAYAWDAIPYITSKFGVYGFTEGLYTYLKPQGIGVSVLCPGSVLTNFAEMIRVSGADPSWVHDAMGIRTVDPALIGPIVADAIAEDRFLILTHSETADELAERHRDIQAALDQQIALDAKPPGSRV
jgi:NAD(P)-dependent dehydrogenase (short-subunit alcohol dehydrogenase family)